VVIFTIHSGPRLVFPIRYIPIPEYRYSGLQIPILYRQKFAGIENV
jgi:hypothetical protein